MTSILKNKYFLSICSVLSIVLLLYLIYLRIDNPIIFPSPLAIVKELGSLLSRISTYNIVAYTLMRLIFSLLISFIIGATLGFISARFKSFRLFINPWMIIFRSTPLAATIVIIMVILGMSNSPYVICLLMLIPVVYEAFLNGILSLDKRLIEVYRLDSSLNSTVIRKVLIPMSIPFIKTAFNQSLGLGIKVLIMAEFICYTPKSIGKALGQAASNLEYATVFAWTIIAIIIIMLIDLLVHYINKIKKD